MKNNGLTREESIRLEAYLLSEKAGHPTGMEQFFWMQAEALVQKRSTTAMPTAKRAATAKATAPKSRVKPKSEEAVLPTSSSPTKKKAATVTAAAEPPKPAAAAKKRAAPVKKAQALPVTK